MIRRWILRLLSTAGAALCLLAAPAHATSTTTISNNIAGMRQLTPANIVQQYPGAAPYYGPSMCQQQLNNFQAQMGPGYSCACPAGARRRISP